MLKSRGPILRDVWRHQKLALFVLSKLRQNLNTRRWLVNALVTWQVTYKITTSENLTLSL